MPTSVPKPVKVQIQDGTSTPPKTLYEYEVPFEWEMDALDLLERAFAFNQTAQSADPFIFTLRYYGYSRNAQFPGYLGYEIENFSDPRTGKPFPTDKHFWELLVDGQIATVGADTMRPEPGSTVTWSYQSFENSPPSLRSTTIASRRP